MSLFHSIVFGYLLNDEVYNLSNGIKNILEGFAVEGHPVKALADRHTYAHEKFDKAMLQNKTSVLTQQIADADEEQDRAFLAFRSYTEAYSYRPEETYSNAADRLLNLIRTHGWSLHNSSYIEETSRLGNLISALENNDWAVTALNTITAQEWFEQMKAAHQAFLDLKAQRRAEYSSKPDYTATEARKEVQAAINDLLNYIEVMYKINADSSYKETGERINLLIDEVMQIARARRTRNMEEQP